MKTAVSLLAGVLLLWAFISAAAAQDPSSRPRIIVAATTADVRETGDVISEIMLLWNRDLRTRPLGHGVLSCARVGSGGIYGGGLHQCVGTFVFPLGKLSVSGLLHSHHRYTLAITGGTGQYTGVHGVLFSRRDSAGARRLTFTL